MSRWSKIEAKAAEFCVAEQPLEGRARLAKLLEQGTWEAEAGMMIEPDNYHQDVPISREMWSDDRLGNPAGTVWGHGFGDVLRADGTKINYSMIVVRPSVHAAVANVEPSIGKKRGRPRKYDWDGALAHVAAFAALDADGLFHKDGRFLNSSEIAELIKQHFIAQIEDHPVDSECRSYADRIVDALDKERRRRSQG